MEAHSDRADIESLPAYVIEWSPEQRRVKFLRTIDDLNDELNPDNHGRLHDSFKRLFVVHGMPTEYVKPLERGLNIDPYFVKAHSRRSRYSPLHIRPRDRWVCFEYPELCSRLSDEVPFEVSVTGLRAYRLSGEGSDAVVFCRASMWLNGENDGVLFLEEPPWKGFSPSLRKETTMVALHAPATENSGDRDDEAQVMDEHLASLEIILQEALRDPDQMIHGLRALLSELVYSHWLMFFESPLVDPESNPAQIVSLAWRVQLAVEHNLNITRYIARRGTVMPITATEWEGLLDRNARRINLATVAAGGAKAIADEFRSIQEGRTGNVRPRLAPGEKDESSRGIDRVSYLGGILLPFTIVPSIMSMADPFGPAGPRFWVFWAVTAPLTVIALLIIYADSIRTASVWTEISIDKAAAEDQAGHTVDVNGKASRYSQGPSNIVEEGVETFPVVIIEKKQDGQSIKVYRKRELGWTGAMKTMVGHGRDEYSYPLSPGRVT